MLRMATSILRESWRQRRVAALGVAAALTPVIAGCTQSAVATSTRSISAPQGHTTSATAPTSTSTAPAAIHHRRRHYPKATAGVPILMFHAIGAPPPGAPYPNLYTSVAAFRADLEALHGAGYQAVTLSRVWAAWHGRASLPSRPIVLTFDDGFSGAYHVALPMLARRGWSGVLFLLIDHLDQPGRWGLTTPQVRALLAHGWQLGSHTYTEVSLPDAPAAAAWHDIAASRAFLRRRFHRPVAFFCYPVGAYDSAVERLVRRAGYLAAVSTVDGVARPASPPDALPRIRVDGNEAAAAILAEIRQFGG
jgi:peptidoglycan/xylan/chitin deacetylase (PgdA/CDA1 family)